MDNSHFRGLTASKLYPPFGGGARGLHRFRGHLTGPDLRAAIWALGLFAASGITAAALFNSGASRPPWWLVIALAGIAAVAERQGIWITERSEMTVSFLPLVFAAVAFGPLAAFIVGGLSSASYICRPYLRWLVYIPVRALSGVLSALAAASVSGVASGFGGYLLSGLAASVALVAADAVFNDVTLIVRGAGGVGFFRVSFAFFFVAVPLSVPLVALLVYGYHAYSLWLVVALLVPLLALQRLMNLYQQERVATRRLASANDRLRSANLSFATALVATLDARDRYTACHSAAVAVYARDIAARLGLDEEKQELVHLAGLVHDIGKIGLPPGLLEKPGALTLEERRQMEKHSEIGEQILRKVDDYGEISDIVRHHHERVDGLGYPDGLRGEQIPLLARVIGVADAYNAMTSDRPYREALPSRVARLRLAQAVESQFDTTVVAAFEAVLASADEDYRMGRSIGFSLDREGVSDTEDEGSLASVVAVAGI